MSGQMDAHCSKPKLEFILDLTVYNSLYVELCNVDCGCTFITVKDTLLVYNPLNVTQLTLLNVSQFKIARVKVCTFGNI